MSINNELVGDLEVKENSGIVSMKPKLLTWVYKAVQNNGGEDG